MTLWQGLVFDSQDTHANAYMRANHTGVLLPQCLGCTLTVKYGCTGLSWAEGAVQVRALRLVLCKHDRVQVPGAFAPGIPGASCSDSIRTSHRKAGSVSLWAGNANAQSSVTVLVLVQALPNVGTNDFFARFTYRVSDPCHLVIWPLPHIPTSHVCCSV